MQKHFFYSLFFSLFLFSALSSQAQLNISLGADTLVCGDSLVLDAGDFGPSTTWTWSTGATTQTLTLFASDTVSVLVSDGVNTGTDTIIVNLLSVPTLPVVSDSSYCLNSVAIPASGGNWDFFWYDAPTGGNYLYTGDTLFPNITDTTTFYPEGIYILSQGQLGPSDNTFGPGGFIGGTIGTDLNVFQDIFLASVGVYANDTVTFDIELQDNMGTVLQSRTVTATEVNGVSKIPVGFHIAPGNGYHLIATNISGGGLFRNTSGANYPTYTLGNIAAIPSASNGNTNAYYYFYDWEIFQVACPGPRASVTANIIPTPIVDLGDDINQCGGSVVFDAGNPGATYVWSTGATTQTITVNTFDTIIVQVTQTAPCFASDTVIAGILAPPPAPIVSDTTFCGTDVVLPASGPSGFLWFDSLSGGNFIFAGDTLITTATDTTTFYVEGANIIQQGQIGPTSNAFGNGGYIAGDSIGIQFSTDVEVFLGSVSTYVNDTTTFDVEVRDLSGVLIASKTFTITEINTKVRLPLGFSIPAGGTYNLLGNNITQGAIYRNTNGSSYPYSLPGFINIPSASNGNTNAFYYFYDWEVVEALCPGPRVPVTARIAQVADVDLGTDTLLCTGTVMLDAGNPGAFYVWSTGEITQTITVAASDTVDVQVAFVPECVIADTIGIRILPPPPAPTVSDSTFCEGSISLPASGGTGDYFWYDSIMSGSFLAAGDTFFTRISDTSTFYVESIHFLNSGFSSPSDNSFTSGGYISSDSIGILFNALEEVFLASTVVYVNDTTSFSVELRDASGMLMASRSHTVTQTGQPVRVALGFTVPKGNGYKLLGRNISQGALYRNNPGAMYPYGLSGFIDIPAASNNTTNAYYYFYDLEVLQAACPGPRATVNANLAPIPKVNLGNDTLVCGTSLTLDAGNSGATYAWSTNETTQTISITGSDTIAVSVDFVPLCPVTDTIIVEIFTPPPAIIAEDSIFCSDQIALLANGGTGAFFWYDSIMAGSFIGSGDTFSVTATMDTSVFYVESVYQLASGNAGPVTNTFGNGAYITGDSVGFAFDALSELVLESVAVYADSATTFNIELRDTSGMLVDIRAYSLSQSQANIKTILPLGFRVPQGVGYQLKVRDIVGGGLFRNNQGVAYPYIAPGLINIKNSSIYNPNIFYYLYDLKVSEAVCPTPRVPVQAVVAQVPVFELGNDTTICNNGNLTLDAGNPGATYAWSTGETTQTVNIGMTDVVDVTVSFVPQCPVNDTISIEILNTLAVPVISDTSFCVGEIFVNATGGNGNYFWYDAASGGNFLSTGDTLFDNLSSSNTYYIESAYVFASGNEGEVDNSFSSGGYISGDSVGHAFDALDDLFLSSVSVYVDDTTSFDIEVRDINGQLVANRSVVVTQLNSKAVVPLGLSIPEGNGYQLLARNISGGQLYRNLPGASYPYMNSGLMNITSSSIGNPNVYYYFYDLELRVSTCPSVRDSANINILPTAMIDLGLDTVVCGGSLLLDAGNPGAAFNWSTGASTQTISIAQSDTVTVFAQYDPQCPDSDTIIVEYFQSAGTPLASDTDFCGKNIELVASSAFGVNLWYDSLMSGQLLSLGDTLQANANDTTIFYVENNQIRNSGFEGPVDNFFGTGGYIKGDDVGVVFNANEDMYLASVSVYVNAKTTFEIYLTDQNGTVLNSRVVTVVDPFIKTAVPVSFFVPEGKNYQLMARNFFGGSVFRNNSGASYPYKKTGIATILFASTGSTGAYYYFYDWEVLTLACPGMRVPVQANVNLAVDLVDSIYTCTDYTITANAHSAANSFLWSTGATSSTLTVSESGTYWVEVSDGLGCTDSDTIRVEIPQVGLADDGILCGNILTTNFTDATFTWSTGDTTPTINVSSPGQYYVDIVEPNGCFLTDTINVSGFDAFPMVDLGADFSSCDSAILDAGNPGLTYLWSTGETTQTIKVFSTGAYTVEVSNANGCTTIDTIAVNVPKSPTALFSSSVNGLTVNFNNLSTFGGYSWDFGDGTTSNQISPSYTYNSSGTYIVELEVINLCGTDIYIDTVMVIGVSIDPELVEDQLTLFPNPTSDRFFVSFGDLQPKSYVVEVYNVQGQLIHAEVSEPGNLHSEIEINTSTLVPGIYMIQVQVDEAVLSRKLIIERE